MKIVNEKNIAFGFFSIISLALLIAALFGKSLGEGGDSTTHFLYAKFSWQNHSYFFNHWAKPFFTIISSPFAQFGMKGIIFFNVCCTILAAWISSLTAKELQIKHWYYSGIMVLAMPLILPVTISGLTEPLSALILVTSVYYFIKNQATLSISVASFLPFIRSEGLIVLGIFGLLLLIKKSYRQLPWILFGHVVFSIAGWFYYKDLLWVFNKIPYATMTSVYGKGNWTHFINQIYFCVGPFICVGFYLGLLFQIRNWIMPNLPKRLDILFLVYGVTLTFIAAHSAFWALGIFNSMGLNRVLVTIFPLIGIIALQGMIGISDLIKDTQSLKWRMIFMIGVLGFPFLSNPASTDFKESIDLKKDHQFMQEVLTPYLANHFPNNRYFATGPELSLFTNRDMFSDGTWIYPGKKDPFNDMKSGDVLVFDSIVMYNEHQILPSQIIGSNLVKDTLFKFENSRNEITDYFVFVKQ